MPSWILGEVDDHLHPLGRPTLEVAPRDRCRQQSTFGGDLGEPHALLTIGDPILALQFVALVSQIAGRLGPPGRAHQLEVVDASDRSVEKPEPVLAPLDFQHGIGGAVDREQIPHEPMAREVLVEGLAPPLRMGPRVPRRRELAHSVVEVLVDRHAVIQAGVVERQRDVVLHIERAVVIGAHTGQPQSLRLITAIHTRVIDRVQPDHPLVDVGPGVIHAVIVEPQEALLLSVVATCRPVQIQVVDPRLRRIPVIPEASQRVSGVAVTLRCIVPVVEVGQERIVVRGRTEVLTIQTVVHVEVVDEPHQIRLAVLGVDHRPRERPVEPVDRARRQGARAGGDPLAGRIERPGRLAVLVDRQHLRRREPVLVDLQLDPVHQRTRRPARAVAAPPLMLRVPERALLTLTRPGRVRPVREVEVGQQCLRDHQRITERVQDQRARRERLDVQRVRPRDRGRVEHPVG